MAKFTLHYQNDDRYSEMNGEHSALDSGAAIIAAYPGIQLEFGGDWHNATASNFDNMAVGESEPASWDRGVLTVTRAA